MRRDSVKKNCNVIKNIAYCHKKIFEYHGKKFIMKTLLLILLSVIVPLLFAVLPSLVIKVLVSNYNISKILTIIGGYTFFICIQKIILTRLQLYFKNSTFSFRLSLFGGLGLKAISIPYEKAESTEGKEEYKKATAAIYNGNTDGIEPMIRYTTILMINILGLLVYSVITASLHPLLIIVLVLCPAGRLILLNLNRKWKEKHKEDWTPIEVKMDYIERESLNLKHGKDIRMYQIEKWFISIYYKLIDKRNYWHKKEKIRNLNSQLVDRIMSLIRDTCCYGYLIYKMIYGMDIVQFTLYLGIIGGFGELIQKIFESYSKLMENNLIINDYRRYMEQEEYHDLGGNTSIPDMKTHSITLKNVWYTYAGEKEPVFKDLNLEIKKGEKLAIVGINGSGKSTLIKLICGIYKPQKGRILLDGIDISSFNLNDYYSLFSVVFQEVFAFAFSLKENIACDLSKNYDEEKMHKCINSSGLREKVNSLTKGINTNLLKDLQDDGINLSGGQLQKLMLARALYKDSSMIILDEPTAALDPIAELEMYEKYNSFTEGKTSIFISHRLSSTAFCDRVIFLKNGKIIEDGTHKELLDLNGEYAKMYKLQSHYYQEEVEEYA